MMKKEELIKAIKEKFGVAPLEFNYHDEKMFLMGYNTAKRDILEIINSEDPVDDIFDTIADFLHQGAEFDNYITIDKEALQEVYENNKTGLRNPDTNI